MSDEVRKLGQVPRQHLAHRSGGPLHDAYHKDLRLYIWGLVLALILTGVPFGLVYWHAMATSSLWIAIGLFAAVQALVHFRYFLHIHSLHENLDETVMIVFTVTILIMMAGGTLWILANLHSRMY